MLAKIKEAFNLIERINYNITFIQQTVLENKLHILNLRNKFDADETLDFFADYIGSEVKLQLKDGRIFAGTIVSYGIQTSYSINPDTKILECSSAPFIVFDTVGAIPVDLTDISWIR